MLKILTHKPKGETQASRKLETQVLLKTIMNVNDNKNWGIDKL